MTTTSSLPNEYSLKNLIDTLPNPPWGLQIYYQKQMEGGVTEITVTYHGSFCDNSQEYCASVGVLTHKKWKIPIGVRAYPWYSSTDKLQRNKRQMLIWHVLKTAWLSPFIEIDKNFGYQLRQAFYITSFMALCPLYETVWQLNRLWKRF